VGSEVIRRIVGDWGGRALAVLVAVSTFGTINASILTGPRVTLAMAADGLFWKRAAHVSPRGTPDFALWLQAGLSAVWLGLAERGFEDVSGWFVTTSWLFSGITVAAVFVSRAREGKAAAARRAAPDVAPVAVPAAPYRTPLYPWTPVLFILVTVALVASDLAASGWRAAAGVVVAALGFPVYHFVQRATGRS
jgi:amino acid transporter